MQDKHATSLDLDTLTANLLSALADRWGVSKLEAVRRALSQTTARTIDLKTPREESMEEQMEIEDLVGAIGPLTKRETDLLALHLQGITNYEIASRLAEDVKVVRSDLNALIMKVRYRLNRAHSLSVARGTAPASRMEAFAELQRRLSLTSAKADEWENAVREARR